VLLDALQTGRSNIRKSLSASEREAEEQQRLRLASLNSQLTTELRREKQDLSRVNEVRADLERARLEFEDFRTRLYAAHPELKVQRGEASIIKADELVATTRHTSLRSPGRVTELTLMFTRWPLAEVNSQNRLESFGDSLQIVI
jgi:hypothetical protein